MNDKSLIADLIEIFDVSNAMYEVVEQSAEKQNYFLSDTLSIDKWGRIDWTKHNLDCEYNFKTYAEQCEKVNLLRCSQPT